MNLLSIRESTVYELLKLQLKPAEIVREIGFSNSSIYTIIQRLVEMKFVQKGESEYVPLVIDYKILHDAKISSIRQDQNKRYLQLQPYEWIRISPHIEQYLRNNNTLNRKTLANKTGLPRYVINRELIRLHNEQGDGAMC